MTHVAGCYCYIGGFRGAPDQLLSLFPVGLHIVLHRLASSINHKPLHADGVESTKRGAATETSPYGSSGIHERAPQAEVYAGSHSISIMIFLPLLQLILEYLDYAKDKMVHFRWTQALLAVSTIAYAQDSSSMSQADGLSSLAATSTNSIATATVSGKTSTFSVPFTMYVDWEARCGQVLTCSC